uniref:ATP synthase F0 subunit 8 n=1 Tax=Elateroidea sp. 6 KM-2017 TaxID=2219429 RepID=A0A346RGB8_9COLE|nr:ATP synthase F0 subunit 8 [Elateroidea sp. 6 KM-2017]
MYQMAPLSWTILFMYFISIYMMMNSLNFFLFNYNPPLNSIKKMKFSTNWKW